MSPVTITLKIATKVFCVTLQFVYKGFHFKHTVCANIYWNYEPLLWPFPWNSNPVFSLHFGSWWPTIKLSWLQKNHYFERCGRNSRIYICPHCDADPEDSNPTFAHNTPAQNDPRHTMFSCKSSTSSEGIFWTKPEHMDTDRQTHRQGVPIYCTNFATGRYDDYWQNTLTRQTSLLSFFITDSFI